MVIVRPGLKISVSTTKRDIKFILLKSTKQLSSKLSSKYLLFNKNNNPYITLHQINKYIYIIYVIFKGLYVVKGFYVVNGWVVFGCYLC